VLRVVFVVVVVGEGLMLVEKAVFVFSGLLWLARAEEWEVKIIEDSKVLGGMDPHELKFHEQISSTSWLCELIDQDNFKYNMVSRGASPIFHDTPWNTIEKFLSPLVCWHQLHDRWHIVRECSLCSSI
jgi:hypothetical protein